MTVSFLSHYSNYCCHFSATTVTMAVIPQSLQ